jgi:flotillin
MTKSSLHLVRERQSTTLTDAPRTTPAPTETSIERYQHGWRTGKPVEDPDKLKSWGFVSARPSEFLACTRRGQIDRRRSGQGARVFKWPWESISIVPTTLQRIEFTADQVTRERVGVEISGIAVFRIAEPLLAVRLLNFSFAEAASEKLAATLREMFVGAARRLVANLTLDDCLSRRKESIAGFLMEEISPIVGGEGSPDDTTSRGWGVVIDTIEIQQVRILSQQVFAHLQAPYRAELAARAELAEFERRRQLIEQGSEVQRREAELAAAAARRDADLERARTLHAIEIVEEERRTKAAADARAVEAERARADAMHDAAIIELAHKRQLDRERVDADLELRRRQADAELEIRARDADARDRESALDAAHQRRLAEIEQLVARDRTLRALVEHALPQIAHALRAPMGDVHYTQIGGAAGGGPLDAVPAALAQLLAIAKSFGLELPASASSSASPKHDPERD